MQYADFITQALEEITLIAQKSFGKVKSTTKDKNSIHVLTETDLEIGRSLLARIQTKYPDHNIIDEEMGVIDKKSNFT